MKTVVVTENAYEAIRWASEHFGSSAFRVKNDFPSRAWRFEFDHADQATYFALKWI